MQRAQYNLKNPIDMVYHVQVSCFILLSNVLVVDVAANDDHRLAPLCHRVRKHSRRHLRLPHAFHLPLCIHSGLCQIALVDHL